MNKKVLLLLIILGGVVIAGVTTLILLNRGGEEVSDTNADVAVDTEAAEVEQATDENNPYFDMDAARPLRGTNTELHEKTVGVLENVFEEVKLIDVNYSQDEFQDREGLTYIVPRLITAGDVEAVRDGLEETGVDMSGIEIGEDTAVLRYAIELDGREFEGRMDLNLGDRHSWIQQKIVLQFHHRN